MSDTVNRQDAIEAVMNTEPVVFDVQTLEPYQKTKDVIAAIEALPSAEPEERTEERMETHTCDCISRQAAVDSLETGAEFLRRVLDDTDVVRSEREKFAWGLGLIESFIADIKELPSAELEPHWIPTIKERPPQHQEIWITDVYGDVEVVYRGDGILWLSNGDNGYYFEDEIIAWMPASVPSPYQPEEDES